MRYVVDTNVPIVANGRDEDGNRRVSIACKIASVEFLSKLLRSHIVVLDDSGAVEEEYRRYLNPRGQPGVGDRFYQEILHRSAERVQYVHLDINEAGNYSDLPQLLIDTNFDLSDRKFAALAAKENVPVANAVDSDWVNHRAELEAVRINVDNVCGCDTARWFD